MTADQSGRSPSPRRPFCNTWPWPSSDLDLVLEADNDHVHKARGCCDGFLPRESIKSAPARVPSATDGAT